MKYWIIGIIMMVSIIPFYAEAVTPEFKQQIRAIVACNDGVDNDGDGLIDFASDPDCISWEDTNEFPELTPNPIPEPVPTPEPNPIPSPQPQPVPRPLPQPIPQPQPDPDIIIPPGRDVIGAEPIQYIIEANTPEIVPITQEDTYEDRVRLDNIFSLLMIGVLSFGLWIWDMFLNTIPK